METVREGTLIQSMTSIKQHRETAQTGGGVLLLLQKCTTLMSVFSLLEQWFLTGGVQSEGVSMHQPQCLSDGWRASEISSLQVFTTLEFGRAASNTICNCPKLTIWRPCLLYISISKECRRWESILYFCIFNTYTFIILLCVQPTALCKEKLIWGWG